MLNVPQEEEATLLVDSELVPILRVANEIETLNPRVAHLCHFHAFEKAHKLDPASSKRGTCRFKTYLLLRLEEINVLTVCVFLYGQLYLVMSGLERSILEDPHIQQNGKPLENALASRSIFQLGLLLVLPMVMEVGLEKGFQTAIGEFILMQLQLASVFFTFQLGTKAHYYGRTIPHGGAKYRTTDHGFVLFHAKFADNYRMYSRCHFCLRTRAVDCLSAAMEAQRCAYSSCFLCFLVASRMFAPFVFNPSGFEWQKTVDDWTDWIKWMENLGGIGVAADRRWESWWESEYEHLKYTSIPHVLPQPFLIED